MWYIWLILSGIFMIAEIVTVGFLIFWLGVGALITMLVSFITDNVIIQTAVFVISSTLLIFCTRPLAKKLTKKDKDVVTNAFAIVGKKALVIKDINPTLGAGQIKVDGQVWSAKCEDDTIIAQGTEVYILKIEGVKAVVTANINQTNNVVNQTSNV